MIPPTAPPTTGPTSLRTLLGCGPGVDDVPCDVIEEVIAGTVDNELSMSREDNTGVVGCIPGMLLEIGVVTSVSESIVDVMSVGGATDEVVGGAADEVVGGARDEVVYGKGNKSAF